MSEARVDPTPRARITRDGYVELVRTLCALHVDKATNTTRHAALVDELRQQFPVMLLRDLKGHNGFNFVHINRSCVAGRWFHDDVAVSVNSSCVCREMSSDPDDNEMQQHQSKLEHLSMRFLSCFPSSLMSDLFGAAEAVRVYNEDPRRCAVAPFVDDE